jgi:hypothetical protein
MERDLEHWNQNILATDRADFSVLEYVRKLAQPEDFNLCEKLEQWRQIGIVTFEEVVPEEHINNLLDDIRFLNDHKSYFDLEVEYKGDRFKLKDLPISPLSDTGIKFNCLENISYAARRLSLNRFVTRFLHHVFQDDPVVIQSLTFWRGSEQPAHLDYPWVCVQTKLPRLAASWIPLEDIHPDAGPLEYYAGTHRPGVLAPYDWGNGSLVQKSDSIGTPEDFCSYLIKEVQRLNLKPQVFLPKKGDLLIWHGNVLHGGTKVKDRSRTRQSYVTHYTSLDAYPSDHRFSDAFESLRFTSLNDGYVFDHPWVRDERDLPSWKSEAGGTLGSATYD